jgi:O-antigen ligase
MLTREFIEGEEPLVSGIGLRRRVERALRISLFVALCAVLMFGPLAFGIVHDWSTALFETGAAVLLLIWMTWQVAARDPRVRWNPLFAPMLAFAVLVLLQIALHRSAYLYDSLSEIWLYAAYSILIFVAVQLSRPEDGGRFALNFGKATALFGAVYALFAVLQGFTSDGRIYWLIKPHAGSVYGTYINHNHYAGLMELLFPLALVLASAGFVRGAQRILLAFGATLMAASVFLCQSRAGMFAIIVETGFLAILWIRHFSPKKSATLFVAFALATVSFLWWIAPKQLGNRMTDMHDPARLLIHRDAMHMFAAHPFFGSGFGTFATVFPRYRAFYDGFFINHAHDDYLELLLETGLVGLAVGVWFIVVLYRNGLRNLRPRRLPPATLLSAAALVSCTGLLVHGFMDFNLHIPANAALFFVLCAVATTPLTSRH